MTAQTNVGCRCRACGRAFYPARKLCVRCLSTEMEAWSLPTSGTLACWVPVHIGRLYETPYAIGYVDFHEDEVRVLGRFVRLSDAESLTPGNEVGVGSSAPGDDAVGPVLTLVGGGSGE